ncbi:Signal recognition particle receptor FtsY [Bienertia sinuspersici]
MKTVSGEVVSSTPVSVSKAAKILSNFASSDNGASPAFAAYLKRSSASFNELAQLHKKHKTLGSKHKVKKSLTKKHKKSVSRSF